MFASVVLVKFSKLLLLYSVRAQYGDVGTSDQIFWWIRAGANSDHVPRQFVTVNVVRIQERWLALQRGRVFIVHCVALHCCEPLQTKKSAFMRSPFALRYVLRGCRDPEGRLQPDQKHPGSVVSILSRLVLMWRPGGLRSLKKGVYPFAFQRMGTNYLPPRTWEWCPQAESPVQCQTQPHRWRLKQLQVTTTVLSLRQGAKKSKLYIIRLEIYNSRLHQLKVKDKQLIIFWFALWNNNVGVIKQKLLFLDLNRIKMCVCCQLQTYLYGCQ